MLNTPIKAFTKPVTDQQITNASSPGVEPSDSLPEADIAGQFTRLMAKGSCFSINPWISICSIKFKKNRILDKKKVAITIVKIKCLNLKAPITSAADGKFCDTFPNFRQKKGMILYKNRLPADDSHEITCLIFLFLKKQQNLQSSSAANYRCHFKG